MTTTWIIITITATGTKTAGGEAFNNYESAGTMQEILERQNPYKCFLVYTMDEWMHECERNA